MLEPDYQPLTIKNITTLPVNVLLSTTGPFFICETDKSLLPETPKVTWQGACVCEKKENKNKLPNFCPEKEYKMTQETNRKNCRKLQKKQQIISSISQWENLCMA